MPDDQCLGDVRGALDALRARPESNGGSGSSATAPAGARAGWRRARSTWRGRRLQARGGRTRRAPDLRCPLLGLFGAEDASPSPDDVAAMARALDEHGKDYEFHSYEGAGHAFFSVDRPAYRLDAARDGWKRIWAFFGEHLQEAERCART